MCKAEDKAIELGATISRGCNWTWANGFPSREIADQFNQWCENNGFETRGVYPNSTGGDVRFR